MGEAWKRRWRVFMAAAAIAVSAAMLASLAVARPWKPTPESLAGDYASIIDSRNPYDMRVIVWIAPPMSDNAAVAEMLDEYVLIGVARAHISSLGRFTFDKVDRLQVKDSAAQPLPLLTGAAIPPTMVRAVSAMETAFSRALGQLGQGIHWFVFKGGSTHACGNGGISVPFAGETYTYDTPFPGCPRA